MASWYGPTVAVLVVLMAGVSLFLGLGDLPVVLWDESRLANNAIEMLDGGSLLVTTYAGEPDTWNTKPPLQIWLMTASMALFGVSEWALRLPSALAALLTVVLAGWFAATATGHRLTGLAAAAILLTMPGFVGTHVARTGDYDSLLVLWTTLAVVGVHRMVCGLLQDGRVPLAWLCAVAGAISAGILTKGIAVLLVVPGLLAFVILRGALPGLLGSPAVWATLVVALVPPAAYYGMRELAAPGYLAAVRMNELGGRFLSGQEANVGPPTYYLDVLFRVLPRPNGSATPWVQVWLPAAALSVLHRTTRDAALLLALVGLSYLAIISVAQTKLPWYAAPLFPLIAIGVALGADAFVALLRRRLPPGAAVDRTVAAVVVGLAGMAAISLAVVVRMNAATATWAAETDAGESPAFLAALSPPTGTVLRIVADDARADGAPVDGYTPQEAFHARRLALQGVDVRVVASTGFRSEPGQWVTWCTHMVRIEPSVAGKVLAESGRCRLVVAGG